MQFGDLKKGNTLYVLYSNNTFEQEIISSVTLTNSLVYFKIESTNLTLRADPSKSIYFDENKDVVLFSEKHNLINGEIEHT
jgi:hypothetical protein